MGFTEYRLSWELYRIERTIASDKAGDKYLVLRRYYFDILISPLLEILFESGVRGAQSKLSSCDTCITAVERLWLTFIARIKIQLNLILNWAQKFL